MVLVELTLMRPIITGYEPKDREIRAFSTKENADGWLKSNGFVFGKHRFSAYPDEEEEWYHKNESFGRFIVVTFYTLNLDNNSNSKFCEHMKNN